MSYSPTQQQQSILNALTASSSSLFIEARAGTGKTATLELCIQTLPPSDRISSLCCAFNKRIAEELLSRFAPLPSPPTCKTLNALGFSLLTRRLTGPRPEVDDRKTYKLMKALLPSNLEEGDWEDIATLTGLAKNNNLREYFPEHLPNLTERFPSISWDTLEQVNTVLHASIEDWTNNRRLDFDDMLWLPLQLGLSLPRYSNIFVDEAQDLNPVQLALLETAASSRMIFFGDPLQSIYAFRGAMTDACTRIKHRYSCTILPLTTTWRCSREVVSFARQYAPDLEAAPTALPGAVTHHPKGTTYFDLVPSSPTTPTFVLCRYNAPLIRLGLALLKLRRPFNFRSGRFESAFRGYLRRLRGRNTKMPLNDLLTRSERMVQDDPRLADYHEALIALSDQGDDPIDVLKKVLNSSSKDPLAPLLATIHAAKGLESHRIIILGWNIPPRPDLSEEDLQQETNLRYVGVTRAKTSLDLLP